MTTLVVLPGLDGTATMHTEFVEAVRPSFERVSVIAYPTNKILGYEELEVLVRASLPKDSPFVLLGESFSGPIALSIAADPPCNLVGLVLSTTFARSPVPLLSAFASFVRFAPVRSIPMFLLSWLLLGRWTTPQLQTALRGALESVDPNVLRARAVAALRVDVSSSLGKISVPVLYLRATRDRLLSRRALTRMASGVSHTLVIDIPGPHLLLQASPEACAEAVNSFSRRLEAQKGSSSATAVSAKAPRSNEVTVQAYAAEVAATLNYVGPLASRLKLPAGIPDKFRISWALLRLTFDHAASIASNFHYHGIELAGSPFALLRPMNEALKRGTWFAFCATDAETADFIANDRIPKRNIAEEIEKHPPFDQFPIFTKQYQSAWDRFHSFTHGGNQVVGAYTMGHGIGPAFPEEDVFKVLDHAEGIAVTAIHVMCMIAGEFTPDVAMATLADLEKVTTARERIAARKKNELA